MHVLTTTVGEADAIERRVRERFPDARVLRVDTAEIVIVNSIGPMAGSETGKALVVGPVDVVLTEAQVTALAESEREVKRAAQADKLGERMQKAEEPREINLPEPKPELGTAKAKK